MGGGVSKIVGMSLRPLTSSLHACWCPIVACTFRPYANTGDAASRGTATGASATHSSTSSYIFIIPLKTCTTTNSYLPLLTTTYYLLLLITTTTYYYYLLLLLLTTTYYYLLLLPLLLPLLLLLGVLSDSL